MLVFAFDLASYRKKCDLVPYRKNTFSCRISPGIYCILPAEFTSERHPLSSYTHISSHVCLYVWYIHGINELCGFPQTLAKQCRAKALRSSQRVLAVNAHGQAEMAAVLSKSRRVASKDLFDREICRGIRFAPRLRLYYSCFTLHEGFQCFVQVLVLWS